MEEGKQWEAGRWAHYLLGSGFSPTREGCMFITCMVMTLPTNKLPLVVLRAPFFPGATKTHSRAGSGPPGKRWVGGWTKTDQQGR
eukprot:1823512-Amphidinium_carterae.1